MLATASSTTSAGRRGGSSSQSLPKINRDDHPVAQPTKHRDMSVEREHLLDARLRLPDYVVHRSFVAETVVLNLETGLYHGLNPMAGYLLDVLGESDSVRAAVIRVSREYERPENEVEEDLVEFCRDLLERDLVEVVPDPVEESPRHLDQ